MSLASMGSNGARMTSSNMSLASMSTVSSMESKPKSNFLKSLKAAFKRKGSDPAAEMSESVTPDGAAERRRKKTFIQHSSQAKFKDRNQTAVVLDFDDTLFPTTFLEQESGLCGKCPADLETHMMDEFEDALAKIEECQSSAELLLRCALNFGHVFIVTLSTRGLLKKRCEAWYPRVWKLLNESKITIVYAIEAHRASLKPDQKKDNSNFSAGHWAWVKGKAIATELDRLYSQYEGQTWKNVISIGDSDFERYGMLGAASAHVQNKIRRTGTTENAAFVQGWASFDNDPDWNEALEGVHEGHIFKVRAKVLKMMDSPSPFDLAEQLTLILDCLPELVCLDDCFNYHFTEVNDATAKSLKSALGLSSEECEVEDFDI